MSGRRAVATLGALLLCMACGDDPTVPGTPTATPRTSAVVALSSANFASLVLASQQAVMVEFYSPTCSACRSMTATVEQLAQDFSGRALVGQVDVSVERALLNTYAIDAVPTFVFFKAGREVGRQVGTTSRSDLAARIEAALAAT